ncbi:MAG: type IX secretion system membrane protein PorP/SprF, partial [Bacteroidetes bacterium]|nr:type IX secretion system membrane protein PorP/SprF [Bacteroidota bacterium]
MKKQFILYIALMGVLRASAQDIDFSQINRLPVLISPANTGTFEKDWRLTGAFRNTSFDAGHTYLTGAAIVERKFHSGRRDAIGLGFSGVFDQSNNGALKSNYLGLAFSYIKGLNEAGNSNLSFGVQGVWSTRRLDVNKLVFEDQLGSGGFSYNIPSADSYRSGSVNYLDLNAGIAYHYTSESFGINAGLGMFHISRPKEQFWGDGYKVPIRYSAEAGAYVRTADRDRLNFQVIGQFQDGQHEYLPGISYSKHVDGKDGLAVDIG